MGKTDKIYAELQAIRENAVHHRVVLERLTTTVEVHEKRSTALEASLKPVQRHVAMVEGVLKVFGAGSIITAIVTWVWKLVH